MRTPAQIARQIVDRVLARLPLPAPLSFSSKPADRWGNRMAKEFSERFPGRCLICSYHGYGISHGHLAPGTLAAPHVCIEAEP